MTISVMAARELLGCSRTSLARRAGVSATTVRNFEMGVWMPHELLIVAMQRAGCWRRVQREGPRREAEEGTALMTGRRRAVIHHSSTLILFLRKTLGFVEQPAPVDSPKRDR
jgi:DNA-binding XRE family transcriptional regulator